MKGESEGHENEKETHGSYGCSTGLYHGSANAGLGDPTSGEP